LAAMLHKKSKEIGRTIYLLGDEPYRKISYGYEVPSLLEIYPNTMICTSYSKDLSLPGERIGWLAIHPDAEDVDGLINGSTLCNRILGFVNAPALMQRVVARLQGVQVDVNLYRKKRDELKEILDSLGYDYIDPQGTFYFFVKSPLENELDFVALLKEQLILTVPGRGFGTPGYFRISYCTDDRFIELSKEGFRKALEKAKLILGEI
ncbi:MAG: aminotransferase class I/II-fold pyridoxal phosphate-dependent enzyme, partial [Spirochaetaceae bacterium]|nr:aminotransferase class I/II-fold pyridoxal phosphate-dependent enzyme [Spirochaetaceae bacterium]